MRPTTGAAILVATVAATSAVMSVVAYLGAATVGVQGRNDSQPERADRGAVGHRARGRSPDGPGCSRFSPR